jgi:hypothetical protein
VRGSDCIEWLGDLVDSEDYDVECQESIMDGWDGVYDELLVFESSEYNDQLGVQ